MSELWKVDPASVSVEMGTKKSPECMELLSTSHSSFYIMIWIYLYSSFALFISP